MKIFEFDYPWTDRREWFLPDDEEMMQGQFPILDEQINAALFYTENRRTCVQAGGAFGLYPLRLADHFEKVWTFEPLLANLQWHEEAQLWMDYSKPVKNSYGAHHVSRRKTAGELVEAEPLDIYDLDDVDLIWLDIEGAESYALQGAIETIRRCQPVVVVEQRRLVQMRKLDVDENSAQRVLESEGYKFVNRTHGDSIYVPGRV
jgi:hypothetical protein